MEQLSQAQKNLSETALGIMAINGIVSDLMSSDATVASYVDGMNRIADLMPKVTTSLMEASQQLIDAAPMMIAKLTLEGRLE